jgi:hypothetical protein
MIFFRSTLSGNRFGCVESNDRFGMVTLLAWPWYSSCSFLVWSWYSSCSFFCFFFWLLKGHCIGCGVVPMRICAFKLPSLFLLDGGPTLEARYRIGGTTTTTTTSSYYSSHDPVKIGGNKGRRLSYWYRRTVMVVLLLLHRIRRASSLGPTHHWSLGEEGVIKRRIRTALVVRVVVEQISRRCSLGQGSGQEGNVFTTRSSHENVGGG